MNIYFVQNLQMFMEKSGISNTELANKLGVSEVAVSRWKSGERNPRSEMIDRMCVIFNCSHNDLMAPNSAEIQEDRECYSETLKLLENLNTEGLKEVARFIRNLNGRFMR